MLKRCGSVDIGTMGAIIDYFLPVPFFTAVDSFTSTELSSLMSSISPSAKIIRVLIGWGKIAWPTNNSYCDHHYHHKKATTMIADVQYNTDGQD